MSTADIRFKRINGGYISLRNSQGKVFDKVDSFEEKVEELAEALKRNNEMLKAIIKHIDIPYKPQPITITKPRLNGR